MTPSIMLYGITLGILLAGAAHFLDLGLRSLRWPARWVWITAMVGISFLPLTSVFLPVGTGRVQVSGAVVPLEALYGLWGTTAPTVTERVSFFQGPGGWLLLSWGSASLLLLLLFGGTLLSLHRKSRAWTRHRTGGEEVLISDGLGPAVLGLLNPRIVLPPWALSLRGEELAMVLLHEGEHRKARDPALLAGGILLVALAPWNPALWWGLRRLRLAVESDCDARVLGRGVSRKSYGQLLLGVASSSDGLFPLAPALVEGGSTFLERRLRMMRNHVGRKRIGGAVVGVMVAGALLALACETPTPPGADMEPVQEPALAEATDPAVDAGSPWTLTEGEAPDATLTGESVLLEKISEDGAITMEAGKAEFLPDENITLTNGVRLRISEPPAGAKAVFEAEPLVFVDGVLVADGDAKAILATLDPDRIQSVEVIKGAAAEALYGERAASGVIHITMKR